MNNKLLIIGSEGFIGKNAMLFFEEQGYDVYGADIFTREGNKYFLLDGEKSDFQKIFMQQRFQLCINASGMANVGLSFEDPIRDFSSNVSNVLNMLESIKKYNPECKFINFSSAAVYGNPESLPTKENSRIHPLSPYGYHKYFSEQICRGYHHLHKLSTLSLRVFSAYGRGLKKQLFWDIYNKVKQSTNNEITVSGDGTESRDFIYILDLLHAIHKLIDKIEFQGQAINVANGEEILIKNAIGTFINKIGPGMRVRFDNTTREGYPKNWKADISILKSVGYESQYGLERGLGIYVDWLRKNG